MASAWDPYLDRLKCADIDSKVMISISDGSLLCSESYPSRLKITADEAATLKQIYDSNKTDALAETGILVAGVKYMFLRRDPDADQKLVSIRGKRKDEGFISIVRSEKSIMIAHVKEGGQAGNANQDLEDVRKILCENNF